MSKRSAVAVFFLGILLSVIYQIYWLVQTKREMVELGFNMPSAWLAITPFASFSWDKQYAIVAEKVTSGRLSQKNCFLLLSLKSIAIVLSVIILRFPFVGDRDMLINIRDGLAVLSGISLAIIQSAFNHIDKPEYIAEYVWEKEIPSGDSLIKN